MSQYETDYGAFTSQDSRGNRTATASYGGSRGGAPVVSFENVSKYYGRLRAVDGLTLDLRAGETTALLGPNGAGKSTSLDMLLALRKPTSGRISMFGDDPYHAVKSGRVGAMLQSGGLMPEVTVACPDVLGRAAVAGPLRARRPRAAGCAGVHGVRQELDAAVDLRVRRH